jgi:sec-independent protein translocase protein TatA
MFGMGTTEIILILLVILVLFGARKIPEFARGLGQGIREFKDAANNVKREVEREANSVQNTGNNAPTNANTKTDGTAK